MTVNKAAIALLWLSTLPAAERVVIVKADGVPAGLLNECVTERDPRTGKSLLPWIEQIFYRQGVRLENFYTRGISLSVPSWVLLDTGQPLLIRGNVEYDRLSARTYDYMNFFPFYVNYARSRRVDMPAVEVLDSVHTPLLADRFDDTAQYQSFQLLQRGVRWTTLQQGLRNRFTSRSWRELLDEWEIGFEMSSSVSEQLERELIERLRDPRIRYLDYFTGDFDHIAHLARDRASQKRALRALDSLLGRIWTAIQSSPLADRTMLVLVSDHGMNSLEQVYSQGYNLIQFFNSEPGGGHHVVTNRHPKGEYKIRALDPFVQRVTSPSSVSSYLAGQSEQYPTVLLDLDGNERAGVALRNSDLNVAQLLLQQLGRRDLPPAVHQATANALAEFSAGRARNWGRELDQLQEELVALRHARDSLRVAVQQQPKTWTPEERATGQDKAARRLAAQLQDWNKSEAQHSEYLRAMRKLLDWQPGQAADPAVIPPQAMGPRNTVRQLQQYVVGLGPHGLVLDAQGGLDWNQSLRRIDYFAALWQLSVRNQVQPELGNRPVDFVAIRAAPDVVWLYGGPERQALLWRQGGLLRYEPVARLSQNADGTLTYDRAAFGPGFPLHLWEDPDLAVAPESRAQWLNTGHTEREWLEAAHRTRYSDAVTGLWEYFGERPLPTGNDEAALVARWQQHRRQLAATDLLILANDHWNFNVRGFNPGGNHGSFFRISTHSVWMMAGGGLPAGLAVAEPYDSLSFVPTLLRLLGKEANGLPGPVVQQVVPEAGGVSAGQER